jgi:hypothetical protein
MQGSRGATAIYLLPGMQTKLTAPAFFIGHGERKRLLVNGTYGTVSLINGFVVDNPDVGTIEPVEGEPAVIYTHKKFAQNKIIFYALTGEQGEVDVIAVPIHDHSSIVTGGPAYGTYFTDDETVDGGSA